VGLENLIATITDGGPSMRKLYIRKDGRNRLIAHLHEVYKSRDEIRKFDPIEYWNFKTPDPHKGVVYRGGTDINYIMFVPGSWDKKISHAQAFRRNGDVTGDGGVTGNGSCRCGYFRGETGMTQNHPTAGWSSFMGAVIYDPSTKTAYITFRGSRSGDGKRAAIGAQLKSIGNPDWVTDMNHLKELVVQKYSGSKLACGFFYAYESCAKSLESAFKFAVGGQKPDHVLVTGHSLGGALAQCAYLDITCGGLGDKLGLTRGGVLIECYPISAPPVAIGRTSQHWFSLHAGASDVHHFYCPKDMVHACNLVIMEGEGVTANKVVTKAHPLTNPYHFGSQTALSRSDAFPDAHEPAVVWQGLNDPPMPPEFWATFDLNATEARPRVKGISPSLYPRLHKAFIESFDKDACVERAEHWVEVITDNSRKEATRDAISDFKAADPTNPRSLLKLRDNIRHYYEVNKKAGNTSTASVFYTLLLGLTFLGSGYE
jgi:hypothetical protein